MSAYVALRLRCIIVLALCLSVLFPAQLASAEKLPPPQTLLDEVGRLAHRVPEAEVAAWKQELHRPQQETEQAARLHLWLGEYTLAHDEQPEQALWHFRQVQKLTQASSPLYGLAAYDGAITLAHEGAYQQAANAFRHLLSPKTALSGYDRRKCALWYRHAGAHAGYHAERAKLGIPEPPRLEPLCAAAALAACLRERNLPFDKQTLLSTCRITGEGSTMQDVLDAARKLGVIARVVTADDRGLIALPKPLVAYVEHDHFVAVVRADKKGVSYLCSDCGPWPGGRIDLTWKQWHAMEANLYAVVTRRGAVSEKWLQAVLAHDKKTTRRTEIKSWTLADLGMTVPDPSQMKEHIFFF